MNREKETCLMGHYDLNTNFNTLKVAGHILQVDQLRFIWLIFDNIRNENFRIIFWHGQGLGPEKSTFD